MDNLPKGWCECRLEDLCHLENGIKQQNLNLPLLDAKFLRGRKEAEYRTSGVVLYDNDVVILVDGENSGEVFTIPQQGIMGSTFKKLHFVDKNIISYVLYCIKSNQALFRTNKKGAAIPHLDKELFKNLSILLPPLAEQERIVEKIEELFSEIDEGIKNLKTAQLQLKQYRQSVLKSAFEGKLYKTTEWKKVCLKNIADIIGGFAFNSKDFSKTGFQILRMGNVKPFKLLLNEKPVYINSLDKKLLDKYLLLKDDIVITLTGTKKKRDYGYVVLLKENNNLLLNQRLARLRPTTSVNPKYLSLALQSEPYQTQFFSYETGNVGQGNVSMKALLEESIALPSLSEQERIVEEIEKRFEVADEMEKAIQESLEDAQKLKQSILKKAFSGQLVPQNPDDEPASILLERIKASNSVQAKGKRK